jgi:uncharacterized membrane-anchored protein
VANSTAGLLVPLNTDLLSPEAWAINITYAEEGYVKDEDADKINYDDLLTNMQDQIR